MESVCIGIDLGGTNLRCGLVSRGGVLLRRESQATDVCSGRTHFLSRLLFVLDGLKREAEASGKRVAAVGLGVPGLMSNDGVIHSSINLMPLQGINLAQTLSLGIGLPVSVLNDANASAIGEQRYGAGRPYRSILMLTIGTGVGAGLILDGRLWTGIDGVAGEFGHVTVEPSGRLCGCGNRGCLEQYASATAIAGCAAGQDVGGAAADAAAVAARALNGEPQAAAAFEQAGSYLGIALAGVVNLLNLEAIILGGGVARSFELLVAPMRREIRVRAFAIPGERVRILKGELGDDAGMLGAAAFAFDALKAR